MAGVRGYACATCAIASVAAMVVSEHSAEGARQPDAQEDAQNAPNCEVAPAPPKEDRRGPHGLGLKDGEEYERPGI